MAQHLTQPLVGGDLQAMDGAQVLRQVPLQVCSVVAHVAQPRLLSLKTTAPPALRSQIQIGESLNLEFVEK